MSPLGTRRRGTLTAFFPSDGTLVRRGQKCPIYNRPKGLNIRSQKCKHLRDQRLGPFKVIYKAGINYCKLLSPKICRLHPVFHCDFLSHALSSTTMRLHRAEIEGDHEDYEVNYISDVKIDNLPRRRGPYLQFLTHFVSVDIP